MTKTLNKDCVYQWRIDAKKSCCIVDDIEKHISNHDGYEIKFIGKHEISKNGKPHYQLCLIFQEGIEINVQHFRNIKKKKWVSETKQPVSFTKARKPDVLMSYVTKEEGDLITNMEYNEYKDIVPWEDKNKEKENKYLYILEYLKKELKDISIDEYVSTHSEYTCYNQIPSPNICAISQNTYEYGDRLDCTQKLEVMVKMAEEYFRKFNIVMTKKTQLKLMIATRMYSMKDYVADSFRHNNIFSVDIYNASGPYSHS